MAKLVKPLTNTEIKQAKGREKEYSLSDGGGLALRVKPNGSKLWIFNYTRPTTRKRTNLSLGVYPALTLLNARKIAQENREILSQGIDPKLFKDQQRQETIEATENTLFNVASRWFEIKKPTITKATGEDCWRSLANHIFPSLGQLPIADITAPIVITVLKPLEQSGRLDMTKRVCQRLNEVMTFAVNTGAVHANPLTGIRSAFHKATKTHNPTLSPEELPEFMSLLSKAPVKVTTRLLIEFQLHTMTRPSEASGAKWSEFDIPEKVWTIPASRMKMRKDHRIPLTNQTIQLLEELKVFNKAYEFVFAGRDPRKPMSSETVNTALKKRMGLQNRITSHGMRALASTTLNEENFESDLIESALSHIDKNEVRAAYNRSDFLDRRRPMMEWWSNHIEKASYGSLSMANSNV